MNPPNDYVDPKINGITAQWLREMGLPINDEGFRMFAHLQTIEPAFHARRVRNLRHRLKRDKRSKQAARRRLFD